MQPPVTITRQCGVSELCPVQWNTRLNADSRYSFELLKPPAPWCSCALVCISKEFWAVADSGEEWNVLKLPYLQNDMQQDGCRTNICWRLLLLMITNGWIGEVKFGMEVNCNNFTLYVQNNSSFKLFKHEAMLIQSVSLLYCRSQNNAVRYFIFPG